MSASDREAITVPAGRKHQEIGVRKLDALRDWQRTAVNAVESIGRRVAGDAARAPDARDERDLVRRPADGRERAINRLQDPEVAAARTPDRLERALVIRGLINSAFHDASLANQSSCGSSSG